MRKHWQLFFAREVMLLQKPKRHHLEESVHQTEINCKKKIKHMVQSYAEGGFENAGSGQINGHSE